MVSASAPTSATLSHTKSKASWIAAETLIPNIRMMSIHALISMFFDLIKESFICEGYFHSHFRNRIWR